MKAQAFLRYFLLLCFALFTLNACEVSIGGGGDNTDCSGFYGVTYGSGYVLDGDIFIDSTSPGYLKGCKAKKGALLYMYASASVKGPILEGTSVMSMSAAQSLFNTPCAYSLPHGYINGGARSFLIWYASPNAACVQRTSVDGAVMSFKESNMGTLVYRRYKSD